MNEVAGNVNLDINYITNTASWNPFYDLRVDSVNAKGAPWGAWRNGIRILD